MSVAHAPDHPALPARVSLLMLPDLGLEARLLVPCDASAVTGRTLDANASCVLRLFRRIGRLRSIVKARTSLCPNPIPGRQEKPHYSDITGALNLATPGNPERHSADV
jgi:hypothetical protein